MVLSVLSVLSLICGRTRPEPPEKARGTPRRRARENIYKKTAPAPSKGVGAVFFYSSGSAVDAAGSGAPSMQDRQQSIINRCSGTSARSAAALIAAPVALSGRIVMLSCFLLYRTLAAICAGDAMGKPPIKLYWYYIPGVICPSTGKAAQYKSTDIVRTC